LLANDRDHHGTTSVGDFAPTFVRQGKVWLLTDADFFR
jgi:hypothetical protein